nr:4996_t:CDS:2 [Entrophospora candida]
MKQNQGNRGNRGSRGSRESHEVIAVGRGRGKSHENNEDIDSVKDTEANDNLNKFSEQSISGTTDQIAHSNTAYDKDNTEPRFVGLEWGKLKN